MIGGVKESNYDSRGSFKEGRDSKSKREIEKEDRGTDKNDAARNIGFLRKMIGMIGIEPVVIMMNLGWSMYWVQTANLYIEKTCKVGSYFYGNGTTFSDEVLFSETSRAKFLHISKFFPFLKKKTCRRSVTTSSMEHFRRSKNMCKRWSPMLKWFPT